MTRAMRNAILLTIYVVLLLLTVFLLLRFGAAQAPQVQKIGFIMQSDHTREGASIYKGISSACETLGAELLLRDNVREYEGGCPHAVDELVRQGASMIILSSPGYTTEMEAYFQQYPSVTFYGIFASAVSFDVPNLTSYSTRMYQARYLSGIVAGSYSASGRIGFVATEASSEVCRNINAFTLGVRRANPTAEVVVIWAGPSDQEAFPAARTLIELDAVDVITYHQDQHTVIDAAEAAGIASIGYYEEIEDVSDLCLTCAACDWGILYEQLIQEYMRGMNNGRVVSEWLGLEADAVGITDCSPLVSQKALAKLETARQDILSGRDVFTGEIYDNTGLLRCGEGESMTDDTLLRNLDWLVEGVIVRE